MSGPSLAEWILTRFAGPASAASIVGDLLEDRDGPFWFSIAGVLVRFAWRPILAGSLAVCVGLFSHDLLHSIVFALSGAHPSSRLWAPLLDLNVAVSILLSTGMTYIVVRYGPRNPFAIALVAAWALSCIMSVYWWMPPALILCLSTGVLAFILVAFSSQRRSILCLSAALTASVLSAEVCWDISFRLSQSGASPLKLMAFLSYVAGLIIQPAMYGAIYRAFFADQLTHPEQGPSPKLSNSR
jgi:hypothetical protein